MLGPMNTLWLVTRDLNRIRKNKASAPQKPEETKPKEEADVFAKQKPVCDAVEKADAPASSIKQANCSYSFTDFRRLLEELNNPF
jgi:hypothetical protein